MNTSKYQQNNDGISFERYLEINKYPVARRANDSSLYIPGQYVVRKPAFDFLKRTNTSESYNQEKSKDYNHDEWKKLFQGKEAKFSVYKPVKKSWLCLLWCKFLNWLLFWRPKKDCESELTKEIKVRIISVCHCCPLQVVQILNSDGSPANDIQDLLSDNGLISPGDDSKPQSTSLEVYDQNQYAFAFDHDQLGINQFESAPNAPIDQTAAVQLYGEYNTNPKAVRVAVIDTGFRMSNIKPSQRNPIRIWKGGGGTSCEMTGDIVGWNFVGQPSIAAIDVQNGINTSENNNPDDDNIGQHGTLISAIIAKKAEQLKIAYPPEIMVLKAFDSKGIGSMFTIVCALCYAETHDADIINASFVVPSNKAISYLEDCLKRLEKKKVVVVCAAGNRSSKKVLNGTDLDSEPLYPACFSEKYTNILTVTTAWNTTQGTGSENHSERAVNLGVWANYPNNKPDDYKFWGYFKAPYELQQWPGAMTDGIIGSSFATPVVTGIVSAKIGSHNGIGGLTTTNSNIRKVLLETMIPKPQPGPSGFIKDDSYVEA